MEEEQISRAADILAAAWRDNVQIAGLAEACRPRSEDDAYAIQWALNGLLGHETVGWKLGHSSPAALRRIGMETPPAGRLFAPTVRDSPASFAADELHAPRLEGEFAYRLGRDLPARPAGYAADEVLAAVDTVFLAIEIADSRFADAQAAGILDAVADNMSTGGFVLGPAVEAWRELDLRALSVTLKVDGETAAAQADGDERCDPPWVLVSAVNNLARRGETLRAGYIVSTGSCFAPHPVPFGCEVVVDFGDLGDVRVTIEAPPGD